MTLKAVLFSSAAIAAFGMSSAFAAKAPPIAVVALHPGSATVKTAPHSATATNVTYTMGVATGVTEKKGYDHKTKLAHTYYTFQSNGSICQPGTHQKIKLSTKKTMYASVSTGTQTNNSGSCSAPTVYYGDVYDLTTTKAANKSDNFTSTLTGDYTSGGTRYKGKLILDVTVTITK